MVIYASQDFLEGETIMKDFFLESAAPFIISLLLVVYFEKNESRQLSDDETKSLIIMTVIQAVNLVAWIQYIFC